MDVHTPITKYLDKIRQNKIKAHKLILFSSFDITYNQIIFKKFSKSL